LVRVSKTPSLSSWYSGSEKAASQNAAISRVALSSACCRRWMMSSAFAMIDGMIAVFLTHFEWIFCDAFSAK